MGEDSALDVRVAEDVRAVRLVLTEQTAHAELSKDDEVAARVERLRDEIAADEDKSAHVLKPPVDEEITFDEGRAPGVFQGQ
ncbi:hypothetical protein F0U61_47675 [Archangium violaceum]|uniref:hypothetical protein n=1 Tax=Archangium violaceum TaxID=83451 RepID=UPI002B2E589F|nr:hypothetical protein F0U61_47675 [Archangium violaceum]